MGTRTFILILMCYSALANYPVFDVTTQMRSILIPASVKLGTIIYRLRASDTDKDYPLSFDATDFGSYVVKIKSLPCSRNSSFCEANVYLDRVLVPGQVFQFRVIVKDTRGDTTTVPTVLTATDTVVNVNTQFPHIPGVIVVPEDAKVGAEVEYVVVRRNLEARKLSELELWGSSAFEMRTKITTKESTTGIILLKEPLDFETRTLYKLDVLATDMLVEPGMDSRNIAGFQVVVVVDDVQDTPPVFINVKPVISLAPNLTVNDVITKITAIDGDRGHPRNIKYGLVSEGHPMTVFFSIDELTGEIRLSKPYHELHTVSSGGPVILMVLAEEERVDLSEPAAQSSTVNVALVFNQAINTPPYFDHVQYITHLDENSPQGTALAFETFQTQVTDDNMGKNGIFSLTLENNNGTFEVWPSVVERKAQFTIRVRNNKNLDFENTQVLSCMIVAKEISSDNSPHLLSSQAPVIVYINDVNDNPPVFSATLYTATLPENTTAGEKVVQVKATDLDTGLGGQVLYTNILGYKNSSLVLDAHSGLITVADGQQFDREESSEYQFQVEARDMQGLGLRTLVPLQLNILDVNDHAPIFLQTPFEFVLASNSRNFSERSYIKAMDQDAEAPNNIVRYEIISGNYDSAFSLHTDTGELRVVSTPRIKRQNEPNTVTSLTVRAYDMGVPHKWSTTQVRIYPPDSAVRSIRFLVPKSQAQLQRKQLEDLLSEMSGGRVSVVNLRPHHDDSEYDRTLVTTQVKYNTDTFVDVDKVKNRLTFEEENQNVIKYKEASSNSWFWWLLFLLVLLLLALLTLLCCLLCPCCPYFAYCYRRNRKVHSAEQQTKISHFSRSISSGPKSIGVQAFETQPLYQPDHQQQPGDTFYLHPDANTRNRDRVVFLSRESPVRSFHSFGRTNRNYDAMLVEDVGDSKEFRVLDPSRLPQQSQALQGEYEEDGGINQRQTVFMKEGNAEIMRLVTQAQAHKETSDNQGKHMIMQRFIQDQNQNQFSVQENIHTDEWRTYDDNVSRENDVRLQHELNEAESRKEKDFHGNHIDSIPQGQSAMHQAQSAMNQGQSGTQVGIEEDEMLKRLIELSKHQDGGLTMLQRDLLVTRFLVEEQRKLLHQAGDTQSLPGGTCAATQTDATKGTQTDEIHLNNLRPPKRQVKSDNDSDSDSEIYHKKKYRIRRYQIKTPILEETENCSEYSLRNRSSSKHDTPGMKLRYISPSLSSLYFYTDESSSSSNHRSVYRTHSHPALRDIESDGTFPYIPPCIKSRLLARRRSQQMEYASDPSPHKEEKRKAGKIGKPPSQPRYMEWYKRKKEERERMKRDIDEEERLRQMGRSRKIRKVEKVETVHFQGSPDSSADRGVKRRDYVRFEDGERGKEGVRGSVRFEDEGSESVMKLKKNQQLVEKKSVFTIAYDDVATERLKSSHDTPPT